MSVLRLHTLPLLAVGLVLATGCPEPTTAPDDDDSSNPDGDDDDATGDDDDATGDDDDATGDDDDATGDDDDATGDDDDATGDDDDSSPADLYQTTGTLEPCSESFDSYVVEGPATITVDTISAATAFDTVLFLAAAPGDYVAPAYEVAWDDSFDCTFEPPNGYQCSQMTVEAGTHEVIVMAAVPYGPCSSDSEGGYLFSSTSADVTPALDDECYPGGWFVGADGDVAGSDCADIGDDDDDATGDDDDDDDDSTGDDDDDATGDDDDDATPMGDYCNPWNPVDAVGSSKVFGMSLYAPSVLSSIGLSDFTGTETMTPIGASTFEGSPTWAVDTVLGGSAGGIDCGDSCATGTYHFTCAPDGGVSLVGWTLTAGIPGLEGGAAASVYAGGGRQILPGIDSMEVGTTWMVNNTQSISIVGVDFSLDLSYEMTFTIAAEEMVTVPAGSFEALRIEIEYTVTDSSGVLYSSPISGLDTTWVAEGIGVVEVDHQRGSADSKGLSPLQTRVLQSMTGLGM